MQNASSFSEPTHGNNSICKAVLGVMTDASTKY